MSFIVDEVQTGGGARERCGKELRREEGKRVLGWGRGEGKRVSVGERGG